MTPDLLNAREVAKRLRISIRTVWRWTAAGILPSPFRLGRITRWRAQDITEHLNTCRRSFSPKKPA